MTFEEWWDTQEEKWGGDIYPIELAKAAWYASRDCPNCGRDLKLSYCPDCGGLNR